MLCSNYQSYNVTLLAQSHSWRICAWTGSLRRFYGNPKWTKLWTIFIVKTSSNFMVKHSFLCSKLSFLLSKLIFFNVQILQIFLVTKYICHKISRSTSIPFQWQNFMLNHIPFQCSTPFHSNRILWFTQRGQKLTVDDIFTHESSNCSYADDMLLYKTTHQLPRLYPIPYYYTCPLSCFLVNIHCIPLPMPSVDTQVCHVIAWHVKH